MTLIEPNDKAELTAGDPNSLALRVSLDWNADRFFHVITLLNDGRSRTLFEPVYDIGEDAWPMHPPLQQASLEEINGRWAILGVGLAGKSHWSVSIEALDKDGLSLVFDYACRSSENPKYLGSRYQWGAEVDGNTDAFAGILCSTDGHFVQVSPDDEGSLASCCKEESWWEICPENRLQSSDAKNNQDSTTRWKYQIRLM